MSSKTPFNFPTFLLLVLGILLLVNAFSAVLYQSIWMAVASSIVAAWCLHLYVQQVWHSS